MSVLRRAWCFVCFYIYLAIPWRWQFTRAGLWVLQYAGGHAHRPAPTMTVEELAVRIARGEKWQLASVRKIDEEKPNV